MKLYRRLAAFAAALLACASTWGATVEVPKQGSGVLTANGRFSAWAVLGLGWEINGIPFPDDGPGSLQITSVHWDPSLCTPTSCSITSVEFGNAVLDVTSFTDTPLHVVLDQLSLDVVTGKLSARVSGLVAVEGQRLDIFASASIDGSAALSRGLDDPAGTQQASFRMYGFANAPTFAEVVCMALGLSQGVIDYVKYIRPQFDLKLTVQAASVPEPGAWGLMGLGAFALYAARRGRRADLA